MTELSLVLVFVVESLNSVVGSSAAFLLGAFLGLSELAELRSVVVIVSSLVLDGVVVVATLVIVGCIFLGAFNPLEVSKIEMLDRHGLSSSVVGLGDSQKDIIFLEFTLIVVGGLLELSTFHLSFTHVILTILFIRLLIVLRFLNIGLCCGILNQLRFS